MSDAEDLQRDLDLIRQIADESVMDIEAASREAVAEVERHLNATQLPGQPFQTPKQPAQPPQELDEDDFYQFQRYWR